MKHTLKDNKGVAMITALAIITCLALLAVVIVSVSILEKKTTFNEYTTMRSFNSADAGTEAAVNWLRIQGYPPALLDADKHVYIPSDYSALSDDHKYQFEITYDRKRIRPGWSIHYKDFEYDVVALGESVQESESEIALHARRLFKEGY
jgi:hypothetical protein